PGPLALRGLALGALLASAGLVGGKIAPALVLGAAHVHAIAAAALGDVKQHIAPGVDREIVALLALLAFAATLVFRRAGGGRQPRRRITRQGGEVDLGAGRGAFLVYLDIEHGLPAIGAVHRPAIDARLWEGV